MTAVFVDTLYWVAIVKPNDPWRKPAEQARVKLRNPCQLFTSDEVLAEFLTALSRGGPTIRRKAAQMVQEIMENEGVTVLPQTHPTFIEALRLYEARADKHYSLTDCASMNAMDNESIHEILTNDHHFEQEPGNHGKNKSQKYVILIKN